MHLTTKNSLLTVACVASYTISCLAQAPESTPQTAQLVGEVVAQYSEQSTRPGYAGRTFPKKNFPVYLFEWKWARGLRGWLNKLEKDIEAARQDPTDSDKWWIVEKRREDAYRDIIESVSARRTRTGDKGRFSFDNLEAGKKYLVVAADEVYEVGIILLYETVGPLEPGKNEVHLVDKH